MNIESPINMTEIKRHADKILNLEFQKREIDEEVTEIMKSVEKLGINTKAFKQVIKSLLKKDAHFCSYVGALSTYTDVFYDETSL
jgi:uncharacterized protein (UPF0335 family)